MALRTLTVDPANKLFITIAGRLTCLCPVNGKRDSATVEVSYQPAAGAVVELAAFAAYLAGFESRTVSHEDATAEIADEIRWSIMSDDLTVRTVWEPVEGIECSMVVTG